MATRALAGFHRPAADLQNLALFSVPGSGNVKQQFLD